VKPGSDGTYSPEQIDRMVKARRAFRMALRADIHPKVLSECLGHATVSITLGTHSHAIPAMQEEAAALIAGLVFAQS